MFEEVKPRHTKIEKVISIKTGKVILEDHHRYPLDECNLYFVAENGETLWFAERPAPDAHYTRVKLDEDGEIVSAYTTGRHACEINLTDGKLVSQVQFK